MIFNPASNCTHTHTHTYIFKPNLLCSVGQHDAAVSYCVLWCWNHTIGEQQYYCLVDVIMFFVFFLLITYNTIRWLYLWQHIFCENC